MNVLSRVGFDAFPARRAVGSFAFVAMLAVLALAAGRSEAFVTASAAAAEAVALLPVTGELLWRWDVPSEGFEGLGPVEKDRLRTDLSERESERLAQVAKLRRIDPAGWRRYLDAKERPTAEGLRLIGEGGKAAGRASSGGASKPALPTAAPALVSGAATAAAEALDGDGAQRVFDGAGGSPAATEASAVAAFQGPAEGPALAVAPERVPGRLAADTRAGGTGGETPPPADAGGAPAGGGDGSPVPGRGYRGLEEYPRAGRSYEPIPDSDWLRGDPGGAADGDNASQGEKLAFWARLGHKLCDAIQIPRIALGFDEKGVGGKVRFKRFMKTLPTGDRALVDDADLTFSAMPKLRLLDLGEGSKLSLGFGADIRGRTMVVRPVKRNGGCKKALRTLDLRDVKAVLPLKARRFAEMGVGEVWHFPVRLRTVIRPVLANGRSGLHFSVHFGYSRSGEPNVTLHRFSEDRLRLRMTIDHAEFYDAGVGVGFYIKGTELGDDVKGALEKALASIPGKLLFDEINKELRAELRLVWRWGGGSKGGIDFNLDPRDPAQMQALEDLLSGDMGALDSLGKAAKAAARGYADEVSEDDVRGMARDASRVLVREESFAGADRYREKKQSVRLKVPIFGSADWSWRTRNDAITVLDDTGRGIDIYRARADREVDLLKFFIGPFVEADTRYSVLAFSKAEGGASSDPVMVFMVQAAVANHTDDQLRELLKEVGGITRLVGARGGAGDPRVGLPIELKTPPDPKTGLYKQGVGAFTVVLGEKALRSIAKASERDVLRAFANAMDPLAGLRTEMEWVVANGRIVDGRLEYDEDALARRFDSDYPQGMRSELVSTVGIIAGGAMRLAREVAGLGRAEDGTQASGAARAERFRDLVGGGSKSRLSYVDVVKVLVQLADPADVHAEFFYRIKGEKTSTGYLVFNPGLADLAKVRLADKALQRFDPPSRLLD